MPVQKKKIIVGSEYKEAFKSLVKILSSGCLENPRATVEKTASGEFVIHTHTADYYYEDRVGTAGGEAAIVMDAKGASWFAPVTRGKSFDDGTSEWKSLIYGVAHDFHNNFSIIEYKQCGGSGDVDRQEVEANINKILSRFFGKKSASIVAGSDRQKGSEDIYGASVRLELSGTGQSRYIVMCKIYFRDTGNGLLPLSSEEAQLIHASLENAPDNDQPISLTSEESAKINDVTVNAVNDLIEGNFRVKFKESLCFSRRQVNTADGRIEDNYDLKTYKHLAERARANKSQVTCTSVRILGISHVKWLNDYYDIAFGNKVVLQAIIGFGGSITLRCVNCRGESLIVSNAITYNVKGADGTKEIRNVVLDYSLANLGVDDDTLKEIKSCSEFANHMFEVNCGNVARLGKSCSALVCRSDIVNVGSVKKCKNCPYPEVVYTDYSGDTPIRYLTQNLVFVNDAMRMTLADNAAKCTSCGRLFTKGSLKGGNCRICAEARSLAPEQVRSAGKLYKRYSNVFSYGVRLKHLTHKKYCVEDETALVFILGDETFVLSKLDLNETGYVAKPVKVD